MGNIKDIEQTKRTWVVAHRGFSGQYPENTCAAFEAAIIAKVDMIEIDVCLTRDRIPVVIHDHTLDRTTDGTGLVSERSLSEIKKLDAGSWFGAEFKGETIPTLEEMLLLIRGRVSVNIEIKPECFESSAPADAIEVQVCELVKQLGMADSVLISSFQHSFFPRIKKWHSDQNITASLRTAPLEEVHQSEEYTLNLCRKLNAYSFHPDDNLVTPSLIKKLKANGIKTIPYTINDEKRMKQLIDWGITGIITNEPERMWKVLRT
ncbi:MAG: Glycerophosphodiester phosphodiesterase [Deltaproteobacteria bacterium]|jgi:glycerophosphoryl diester phosphodiesterase|nr:Glycerophosphodiester phosphodiesterase [Deltaproteobacteria bacterium]